MAAEQTIRLEDAVKRLQQGQRTVLDRTRQLDRSRQAEGQWTRLMATDLLEVRAAGKRRRVQRRAVGPRA